jgi:hypothetical protein
MSNPLHISEYFASDLNPFSGIADTKESDVSQAIEQFPFVGSAGVSPATVGVPPPDFINGLL